jgi:hypothetical protein
MTRRGILPCCGGFAEHFEWCPDDTERQRRELHALLLRRGEVQDNYIVAQAFDALAASYGDATDRGWDAASDHMAERP